MSYQRVEIPESDIQRQLDICAQLRAHFSAGGRQPLAMVDTYGCQQNEADSEKLRGYLRAMGFDFTQDEFAADVVVMNTCAVREHAETRVFGNVGALTHTKARNPEQIIAVCGCMAQQEHVAEKLKKSYRIVDLVFGPHELWRFPELLRSVCTEHRRVFAIDPADGSVAEGIPRQRDGSVKAWLSIMYGCNNFCTYCIVPYVRGRERSRHPEEIVQEARELVAAGYKDITLLGQNVDSYGRDLDEDVDFADLIRSINAIPGDFVIRFMSSHPKDATEKLFRAMAECEKCAHQMHLPVQSGNDRVLHAMNRGYTREKYLAQVALARQYMPDLVLTTDIIVGFPGETDEEFQDTLSLVETVRYDFIYSPRVGTPAAKMPDPYTRAQKQVRFDALVASANAISEQKHRAYEGSVQRVRFPGNVVIGPSFTPDNKVAVALSNGRYPVIFLLNHGFQKERILEGGNSINVSPTFDKTGTKMAFTSSRLGGPQIFMKDLSSGSITRVSKNGGYNTEANLSPDGTLVTYSRMTEYGHRIFVQDMVTGLERQITFGPGSDEQPSFCADSYFIAFASSRGGSRGIYLTTRHGGDAKKVPTGGGAASFPRWGMPDGK